MDLFPIIIPWLSHHYPVINYKLYYMWLSRYYWLYPMIDWYPQARISHLCCWLTDSRFLEETDHSPQGQKSEWHRPQPSKILCQPWPHGQKMATRYDGEGLNMVASGCSAKERRMRVSICFHVQIEINWGRSFILKHCHVFWWTR